MRRLGCSALSLLPLLPPAQQMQTLVLTAIILLATCYRALAADDLSERAYDILKTNCFSCHGAAKTSGLDLRTRDSILAGGQQGPAVVPGEPENSRLYLAAAHERKPTMPPGQKLPEADLRTLRDWIEAGASLDPAPEAAPEPKQAIPERPITPEERSYWAFQKPKRARPRGAGNPIDAFLQAALKAKGVKPAPRADRRDLIRRAYLDLLGLPPSPAEIEAFV